MRDDILYGVQFFDVIYRMDLFRLINDAFVLEVRGFLVSVRTYEVLLSLIKFLSRLILKGACVSDNK